MPISIESQPNPSENPTRPNNRFLETLIKAEDISSGSIGFGPFGPHLTSGLPNGLHLGFTIDPYIYFKTDIQNPEDVESFTVRFIAYTEKNTPEGLAAEFLPDEGVEALLCPSDGKMRIVCDGVKELNGLELTISREELREVEHFACERERQEAEMARLLDTQNETENLLTQSM